LLKEEFDALVHNKGVQHEDNFEHFLMMEFVAVLAR